MSSFVLGARNKVYFYSMFVVILSVLLLGSSSNPPNGNTGAPGEGLCSNCHGSPGGLDGLISLTGLPTEIQPNTSYDLTLTLTKTAGTPVRGGFQLVALDGNNSNTGTFSNAGSNVTFQSSGGKTYAEHNPFKNFSGGDQVQFTFRWTSPAQLPGNQVNMYFSGLLANGNGNTSGDRTVNTSLEAMMVSGGNDPEVEIINVVNVNCAGGSDGSATASVTNGIPPYVYNWSNGAQTATASNLAAGTYSVTVTDANSATTSASVTITQPSALSINVILQEVITCADPSATVSVAASGGVPPYDYLWSNGSGDPSIEVQNGGNYVVTVTDANDCSQTLNVNVLEDNDAPVISAGPDRSIACAGGTITLQGNGPSGGGYAIVWTTSNGVILSGANTYNPVVNAAGQYVLTVVNTNNGCASEDEMTVNPVPAALNMTFQVENVSCFGASDGRVTSNVSGGVAPYSYLWSNGQSQSEAVNLTAGTYTLTITDANGCTLSGSAVVNQPAALAISFTVTPLSGPAENDGAIESILSGGTPPYNYVWSNGETTSIISGLSPGTYSVTSTDAKGCFIIGSATIQPFDCNLELSLLNLENVSCFGAEDGGALVEALQGEGVVTYVWSNGSQGSKLENVGPGDYVVTVTDETGCTATLGVVIGQPAEIIINLQITPLSGVGESDGAINAEVSGGSGNITYAWSTGEVTPLIEMLPEGTYSITVTDENGCTAEAQAVIRFECLLDGDINIVQSISCFGDSNGVLEIVPVNGRAPYQYLWEDGSVENSLSNLSAGVYRVTITDDTNCTIEKSISLNQPDSLSAEILTYTQTIEQEGEGVIEVIGTGGTPPYQYAWQKEGEDVGDESVLDNLGAGDYLLQIKDANDCGYEMAFRIDVVTSVENGDLNAFKWRIYPNPVQSLLHVEVNGLEEDIQLSVMDAMGREVLSDIITAGQSIRTASVETLSNGIYYVLIKYSNGIASKRMIIAH